jgi:acyl phosphate:glycerol-3-phosphate acyltransferase
MPTLLVIVFAYLCGSIPTGVIIARRLGIDVRKAGSGNIGATNVARSVGKKAGLFTLLGDAAKGLIPVLIVRALDLGETPLACAAVAALLGHVFSPFLNFSGGKGVATGLGVFLGLAPQAILIALLLFAFTFAVSHIVSLASLVATGATPVLLFLLSYPQGHVFAGLIIAGVIILRHHENIARLLKGQEAPFSMKKPPSSAA